MGLEEQEEATLEVATSCIFVICICVFPLLIEKHMGDKGHWALERWKEGGKIGEANSFICLFLVLFFVCIFFPLLLCHE